MAKKKDSFGNMAATFFGPVKDTKKSFFQVVFASIIGGITPIVSIGILEKIVSSVETGNMEQFYWYVAAFFVIVIALYGCVYMLRYWSLNYYPETRKWLEKKYITKYLLLNNNTAETIGTGRLLATMQNGIQYRLNLYRNILADGVQKVSFVLFSLAYIGFIIGWYVVLFILGGIAVFFFIERINTFALAARNKRRDVEYTYTKNLVKIIHSKFDILQNNKIGSEIQNICNLRDTWYIHHKKTADNIRIILSIPMILISVVTGIMVFVLGKQVLLTGQGYGELTALMAIMGMFSKIVLELLHFYREFTRDFSYVQKLWDIFSDTTQQHIVLDMGNNFSYKQGNISLHNISFSYDFSSNGPHPQPFSSKEKGEKNRVFRDFSLEIEGGKKTAFVGESGGGKTTLIKLIAGYIRPDAGEINIDGQRLTGKNHPQHPNPSPSLSKRGLGGDFISLQSYYKHIGYLSQDPNVFDGTIYENLVYGIGEIPPSPFDPEQSGLQSRKGGVLEEIIHLAKCEFIWDFPKGLETEIGERGVRLSGGQKQRLAIAKIMLKNPNIILLDEPTSALDSFNEELISIALHNLFQGKTVIVVAHRLQTVKQADRICYIEQIPPTPFDKGGARVVEEGTHDELVALHGKYKKMLDLQSGF